MTADPVSAAATQAPPWSWRIAAWTATGLAVLALGTAIAHWGWRLLGPAPPVPVLASERATPSIAVPLFGSAPAPSGASGGGTSSPRGDARLLGVFAEKGGTGYALFRLADHGPVLVKAGSEIAGGMTLVEVRPAGVRVLDRGEFRDIELRALAAVAAPARPGPNPACAPPAGYKGPVYRLNAELLTGIASRPESWQALLVPVGGGLAVRDGSAFATMLGMKSGDRMAQANGIALTGIDDVLVAFVNPLIANQAVVVTGVRDGMPANWLFVNAGACPG